jgi:hypothetical protein
LSNAAQALSSNGHLVAGGAAQFDRMSQPEPLTSWNTGNGNGDTHTHQNEGDRHVSIVMNNQTHIAGGPGQTQLYARDHERIHGDLLRNAKAAMS